MKNSLISMSAAVLLASNSIAAFASGVTIPNSFTAGTTAVAADVNTNFDAVAVGVNDNDSRITTNAAGISTNTGNITTNAGNITTNAGAISGLDTRVGVNETDITGLDTRVGDNETNIAANAAGITNLENGVATCPSDMVAVGSLCVDTYEASLWDAASGGTQLVIAGGAPYWPCSENGSDCGGAIFAQSVDLVLPANRVTWHQAVAACANVGKRLPTAAEWQMAAAGTPEGTGVPPTGCVSDAINLGPASTASSASCVSTAGAFDMVGNVWEWVAEITPNIAPTVIFADAGTAGNFIGMSFGEAYDNASTPATPSTRSVFVADNSTAIEAGLLTTNGRSGFRCVR